MPLSWEDRACRESCPPQSESTFRVKTTGRPAKLAVSSDGAGIVGQAGGVLLIETLRVTGLDRALSAGLERWRRPRAVHDPGKVVADLAVTLALGGDCLSDIAILRAEPELFGPVSSDPTVSRLVTTLPRPARRRCGRSARPGRRPAPGPGNWPVSTPRAPAVT
ncbi:hypothetical protein E1293_14580 [Actinomadura darangshiensis]|uniref:Transposase DDE domain-containing protein n=1 Tax=Actinomadura darangshiensis TaxID=705336 RepID=A0A4R5BIE3_9ACTN|nr:hypothetical protein E1293_14580 [Actinomadura darangshiensis]